MSRCIVTNNGCSSGGGGVALTDGGSLLRCTIVDNQVKTNGGGFFIDTEGVLENCVVARNYAAEHGGGGYLHYASRSDLWISHCTITGNSAGGEGGGIYFRSGGKLQNSIVYGNTAADERYADWNEWSTNPEIRHTCAERLISGSYGVGNITNAPMFLEPENLVFNLHAGSPCVDASPTNVVAFDMNGVLRPLDGDSDGIAAADLGAFERVVPLLDSDGDSIPDEWEDRMGLDADLDDSESDGDGDSMLAWQEFIAGTHPFREDSLLQLRAAPDLRDPRPILWDGVAGRFYTLWGSEMLGPDAAWHRVDGASDMLGADGVMEWEPPMAMPYRYYRLEVHLTVP